VNTRSIPLSQDQKFFDYYSLIIGALAVVALGLFVLSINMSEQTQGVFTREAPEYQAAVTERIRPIGQVLLPGDEVPAAAAVETAPTPEPVAEVLTGPQVYNQACLACHGPGIGGAPVLGDVAVWTPRIAQGLDVLVDHAINGFTGELGYMPPKGGRMDLSDGEVTAAVEYMIEESQ